MIKIRKWWNKFLCRIEWHQEEVVGSYRHKVKLFKRVYDANGWNTNYKVIGYKCKRCGRYWEEHEN